MCADACIGGGEVQMMACWTSATCYSPMSPLPYSLKFVDQGF